MATTEAPDKRARLIQAATKVVYQQGFNDTTIADIAGEARVPLGNVYYYFKTKEAIGEALVEQHLTGNRALRRQWEDDPDPRHRLCAFVRLTMANRHQLARSGCPMGSLCTELGKAGGSLAGQANRLLSEWLEWLAEQFRALGRGRESRGLAVHLLAALQGVAVVAHSSGSPRYVEGEVRRLIEWIDAL